MSKREFVIPGSFLGTEEEFSPGQNTFGDRSGNIYATSIGEKELDLKKREANVIKKAKIVRPLEAGSVVLAQVTNVREMLAFLELIEAEKDSEPRTIASSKAKIRIVNVSADYVKDMGSVFRIGDIIRARVVEVTPYSIELSTKGSGEFGVVKAFCVRCRQKLLSFGPKLKCGNCGNTEDRKIAADYLLK